MTVAIPLMTGQDMRGRGAIIIAAAGATAGCVDAPVACGVWELIASDKALDAGTVDHVWLVAAEFKCKWELLNSSYFFVNISYC